jgi:hypothetical protein
MTLLLDEGTYYSSDGSWMWDADLDDWVPTPAPLLARPVPHAVTAVVGLLAAALLVGVGVARYAGHQQAAQTQCSVEQSEARLANRPVTLC